MVETPDPSEQYEIYVGRSEDCHVVIEDPLISRHHFVLKNENNKWFCEKLSQLGIVSVNGVSSGIIEIHEGDEIKCGAYSLLVADLPRSSGTSSTHSQPGPVFYEEPKPQAPQAPAYTPPPQEELSPVDDLTSIDDMSDDLVLSEEQDETEVLSSSDSENESFEDNSLDNDFSDNMNESPQEEIPTEEEGLSSEGFGGDDLSSFSDDSGNLDSDGGDEKTSFFKAFVNYQLVLFGDLAPYDRYQIDTNEIFIGRDPKKCQIVLDDPEVSTVHAVLRKNAIDVTIEDLNSSNGTILNGERINKAHLGTGDEFIIGSTSFTLETRSDLLEAESDRLMPVEDGQTIETEEFEEELVDVSEMGDVDFNSEGPPEKSLFKRFKKDPAFRKKVIYVVAALGLGYVFFGDSETPPATTPAPVAKTETAEKPADNKLQLSKELEQKRNTAYELGVGFYDQTKYFEALKEFQTVVEIDPNYKNVQSFLDLTKLELKRVEEEAAAKAAEADRQKTKKIIEELLVKAREAVKDKNITVAESYFAQIAEKDPENMEVQQLKMELESWQKEQERIALEKAAKEASRKAMVDALNPGKTYYLKKEWYKAILKLEEFLRRKAMDEDLIKEGSDMLADSKNQLASELGPLIGKARSLKEGQDLKSAYEAFLEVLKIEPTNAEALNEVDDIKDQLEARSKKIYREAIIAESLSLFNDAKEKFQEVLQVSPTDSEYYKKASEKLKNYLE